MTINGNILNEKGNLKPAARTAILEAIAANPALLGTATPVKANVYSLPISDSEGNTVYVNIDLSVSTLYAGDRKEPAKKVKPAAEAEVFELID